MSFLAGMFTMLLLELIVIHVYLYISGWFD